MRLDKKSGTVCHLAPVSLMHKSLHYLAGGQKALKNLEQRNKMIIL